MGTKYFTLLTQVGEKKLAAAIAAGKALELAQMGVGDGNGVLPTPDPLQTKLVNEKRRGVINSLTVDPDNTNQMIAEQVIPENEGGFWLREIGLYDIDGDLIALGNCPETYKPELKEGSGRVQTVRMILIVSRTDAITLKFDPTVALATRRYADTLLADHVAAINPHRQYAPIESPAFTGTATAPTAPISNKTMQIATTEFVHAANTGIVGDMRNARMRVASVSATASFFADEIVVTDRTSGARYRVNDFAEMIDLNKNGAGGAIAGFVPATGFVALYVIFNPENKKHALFAIDATIAKAPETCSVQLPDGYTASALVSIWQVVGGKFSIGFQLGRYIYIRTQTIFITTEPTTALHPVSVSALVPVNAISVSGYGQSNGVSAALNSIWMIAGDENGVGQVNVGTGNSGNLIPFKDIPLITQQTVYLFAYTANGSFVSAYFGINGYAF
ncbi:phage tail protein [Dickeya parazeae]|uniref:phage tail protein n=1 Tax=Dickeya parazeae TaxID=2893572 RepID=UPI001F35C48F|nr:phage tail protein [Dickeya parazeae]